MANSKLNETQLRKRIQQTLSTQAQDTVTVLSSLLQIERSFGYIPNEAIEEVAQFCDKTINEVWSVVAYYTNFRFTKPGKLTVQVCWGASCHVLGAQHILRAIQAHFGIKEEGESADGALTLRYNTCLGACAQAPVIAFGHEPRGRVTPEGALMLIKSKMESQNGVH